MDRETVVRQLETDYRDAERRGWIFVPISRRTVKDALALLKEQEVVEPKQVDLYGNDEWWGLVCVCPDCKAEWMSDKADTHFCPKCGKKVKWE